MTSSFTHWLGDDEPQGLLDQIVARLQSLDGLGDAYFERLRQNEMATTVAKVLSTSADYGVVWIVLAAWLARKPGQQRTRAIAALALAGVGSYGINRLVKSLVNRERPEGVDEFHSAGAIPLRRPSSSSFPSGHTMAAFAAAIALPPSAGGVALATGFASAVAASRVQLRAHHLSDVIAGAVIGIVIGICVRMVLSLFFSPKKKAE